MSAVILEFRRRLFPFHGIQRVTTNDRTIEEPDGSWWTERRRPPGPGWEIERDRERHTVWRRVV